MDSTKAGRAGTGVAVDAVGAVGPVLTRVALTLVDVLFALCAPKAGQAGAQEAIHLIFAEASVAAGVGLAVINVGFTVASGEAWFAAAAVTAHGVLAGCSIETRILHTLFDVHLTRLALPSFWTFTGEALIVLRLLTHSSMFAGFRAAGCH